MIDENNIISKINDLKAGVITFNNDYNTDTSITCEKIVTLHDLNEYDKKIKNYIDSKIKRVEVQERLGYFKRMM